MDAPDFAITTDADGTVHAIGLNNPVRLSVLPDGRQSRAFKRNAIKAVGTPAARKICWLVGELDGVRVYVNTALDGEVKLIMTRQDLNP